MQASFLSLFARSFSLAYLPVSSVGAEHALNLGLLHKHKPQVRLEGSALFPGNGCLTAIGYALHNDKAGQLTVAGLWTFAQPEAVRFYVQSMILHKPSSLPAYPGFLNGGVGFSLGTGVRSAWGNQGQVGLGFFLDIQPGSKLFPSGTPLNQLGLLAECSGLYYRMSLEGKLGAGSKPLAKPQASEGLERPRTTTASPAHSLHFLFEGLLPAFKYLGAKVGIDAFFGKNLATKATTCCGNVAIRSHLELHMTPIPLISLIAGVEQVNKKAFQLTPPGLYGGINVRYRLGMPLAQQLASHSVSALRWQANDVYGVAYHNTSVMWCLESDSSLDTKAPKPTESTQTSQVASRKDWAEKKAAGIKPDATADHSFGVEGGSSKDSPFFGADQEVVGDETGSNSTPSLQEAGSDLASPLPKEGSSHSQASDQDFHAAETVEETKEPLGFPSQSTAEDANPHVVVEGVGKASEAPFVGAAGSAVPLDPMSQGRMEEQVTRSVESEEARSEFRADSKPTVLEQATGSQASDQDFHAAETVEETKEPLGFPSQSTAEDANPHVVEGVGKASEVPFVEAAGSAVPLDPTSQGRMEEQVTRSVESEEARSEFRADSKPTVLEQATGSQASDQNSHLLEPDIRSKLDFTAADVNKVAENLSHWKNLHPNCLTNAFWIEVILKKPSIFPGLPNEFKTKPVVLAAVERCGENLLHIPADLQQELFLLKAVNRNPAAITYLSDKDPLLSLYVWREVLKEKPKELKRLPEQLKKDKKFCLKVISTNPNAFLYLPEAYRTDKEFCRAVFDEYPEVRPFLPPGFQTKPVSEPNKEKDWFKGVNADPFQSLNWGAFQPNSGFSFNATKFWLNAIKEEKATFTDLPYNLQTDQEFCLKAVEARASFLAELPEEVQRNRRFLPVALRRQPAALKFVPPTSSRIRSISLNTLIWLRIRALSYTYLTNSKITKPFCIASLR